MLKPRQYRLTDAKGLKRCFISTSQQMFIVQGRQAEEIAQQMG